MILKLFRSTVVKRPCHSLLSSNSTSLKLFYSTTAKPSPKPALQRNGFKQQKKANPNSVRGPQKHQDKENNNFVSFGDALISTSNEFKATNPVQAADILRVLFKRKLGTAIPANKSFIELNSAKLFELLKFDSTNACNELLWLILHDLKKKIAKAAPVEAEMKLSDIVTDFLAELKAVPQFQPNSGTLQVVLEAAVDLRTFEYGERLFKQLVPSVISEPSVEVIRQLVTIQLHMSDSLDVKQIMGYIEKLSAQFPALELSKDISINLPIFTVYQDAVRENYQALKQVLESLKDRCKQDLGSDQGSEVLKIYNIMIKAAIVNEEQPYMYQILSDIAASHPTKSLPQPTVVTVLNAFKKVNKLKRGIYFLNILQKDYNTTPTTQHYNIILRSFIDNVQLDEAERLYDKMKHESATNTSIIPNDEETLSLMVHAYTNTGKMKKAEEAFATAAKIAKSKRQKVPLPLCNDVLRGYCKQGKMKEAEAVIEKMKEVGQQPDVITYNNLMWGYLQLRQPDTEAAEALLRKMKSEKIKPISSTFTILLNGFTQLHSKHPKKMNAEALKAKVEELQEMMQKEGMRKDHAFIHSLKKATNFF